MNKRFIKILSLVAGSAVFISGCGDNSSFETPNTSETPVNNGLISQKNLTLLFSETRPKFFDVTTGEFTPVTSEVSVQIGDNKNQLITGSHTIHFKTEWGLIDPSCITENGGCSVTWSSGSSIDMPANFLSNVLAYSINGQESFTDVDGNGLFNDGDTFEDLEEPYLDANENDIFDTGDFIVDVVNGIDLTGANTQHDGIDGLYNGPNCTHSSKCSSTLKTSVVWENGSFDLTGGTIGSGGASYPNVTLNSHIPEQILATTILQDAFVQDKLFMGNSTSQFAYLTWGTIDREYYLNLAEDTGQTELGKINSLLDDTVMSGDSSLMVYSNGGMQTIDLTTQATQQIGAAFGLFYVSINYLRISDDGSLLAFIVDQDITGGNPSFFGQIFTLTTDGSDVLTQVSNFTTDHFSSNDFHLALSGDGNTIFFHSKSDVLNDGSNADGSDEIFSINTDGTGLASLSTLDMTADVHEMKSDSNGGNVVFLSSDDVLYSLTTTTKVITIIDTLSWSHDFLLGTPIRQYDISADGSTIYYTTRNTITASTGEHEKLIYAINSDGTNKRQVFTTGIIFSGDGTIMSPESSTDGTTVSFISSFDFGKTIADENTKQVYTLTP
ncbi:MAG: hypothetical protein QNL62_04570 [Gammaproteobacteria bacterium]|nr:hypothetical protein [Gammaproteobacteria bacterium]